MKGHCWYPEDPEDGSFPPEGFDEWRDPSGLCEHETCDDRPGSDFYQCRRAGHIEWCEGGQGGDHELREGWIAIEQPDGTVVEVEVAA